MSVQWLPESNLRVLEHLATYRYLTVPQMITLGVAKHKSTIYSILKRFKMLPRKLIEQKNFGLIPGKKNIHSIFFLTRQGAKLLAEVYRIDSDQISYPKGVYVFQNDYFHRVATIDFHISLRQWAERLDVTVVSFDTYFDKTGSNRGGSGGKLRAKTRFDLSDRSFIPDVVYMILLPDGRPRLVTVEIHNGRDTGRFLKQMETHIEALEEGVVSIKHRVDFANSIRWVFEHESTMRAAMRRMGQRGDYDAFRPYIEFNTVSQVKADFSEGWEHF